MDKVSFLQKAVSESLEKLSLPEASWTLRELKATGRKFTYKFAGKTEEKTPEELALAGIEALAGFVKEIGLPSTLTEMGITDKSVLKKVADTCNLTAGCCKKFSREEILQILEECW